MADIRKNVVWTDREMTRIAQFMIDAMARDGQLSLLQAARLAQDSLGKGRQRNIQAWSTVEPKIGPKLTALRSSSAPQDTAVAHAASGNTHDPESVSAATSTEVSCTAEAAVDPEPQAPAPQDLPVVANDSEAQASQALQPATSAAVSEAHGTSWLKGELRSVAESLALGGEEETDLTPNPGEDSQVAGPGLPPPQAPGVESLNVAADGMAIETSPKPAHVTALRAAPQTAVLAQKPETPSPKPVNQAKGRQIALDPLQIEAALLVALQSPVISRALVDLMGASMAQAFARFSASVNGSVDSEPVQRVPPEAQGRVLVAGFSDGQARAMVSALEDAQEGPFEVRVWKAHQTPQMLETSARICALAVIPEDAPDEFQEHLAGLGIKVLRHEGGVGRLAERVGHALD